MLYYPSSCEISMLYRGRRDVETYRSGRNEPHSKCGYAFTGVREFESLRFRQTKPESNTAVFGLGFSFCLSFIVKNPPMRR